MVRLAATALLALLAITSPALAQTDAVPSAAAALAIGETFTIASKALGETRRINVYLPPPYAESPGKGFPVLYMPDGGLAEDFLHLAGLVQVSVGNGTMRPMVLVGIENTQRRRDLTGPTRVAADRKIAPVVGGSAAFRSFVRDELIPEVNRRYRTTAERAIIGESLAGLFIVETFFVEPALFDSYVAFDPSREFGDGSGGRFWGTVLGDGSRGAEPESDVRGFFRIESNSKSNSKSVHRRARRARRGCAA